MVMWNTPNLRDLVPATDGFWQTALLICGGIALLLLLGCTSIDGPTAEVGEWKNEWKERGARVADGASRAGEAVGDSVVTAYSGVKTGFEEPDGTNFGPYPKSYVATIKRHMLRFEGVSDEATFQFGKPEKGFMNKGILAGGKIDWQGYLIDLNIASTTFAGQSRSKSYVVRMKDGEVVEVHDAEYAAALRRLEANEPAPANRAR